MRVRALAPYAIAGVSLAAFFAWTLTDIGRPGLEYDETIFVNAALGGDYADRAYVYRELFGVPTMLMPYIGALKAWLYAPVFALFGVSVETIRVPMILLAGGTIALAFVLARRLFGLWPAALLAVLLATDTTFAILSKADFGPTVLSAFFRVVALVAYFSFVRTRAPWALWLLAAALGLGLFNKLDFGLFIAALVVAALAVDRRVFSRAIAERPVQLLPPIALFAAWLAYAGVTLIKPALELDLATTDPSVTHHVRHTWDLFILTASGEGPYEWMTGSVLEGDRLSHALTWAIVAVVAAHVALILRRGAEARTPAARAGAFLVVLLVVLTVELALARQVGGAQHLLLIWPLPSLLAVALLARSDLGLAPVALVAAFSAIAVGAHMTTAAAYTRAFDDDHRWSTVWSPEIYRMADRVDAENGRFDSVITADWGIGQMLALVDDDERARFHDLGGTFVALKGAPPPDVRAAASTWFAGRRVLVLTHTDRAQMIPDANRRLRAIVRSLPGARVRPIYAGRTFAVWLVDA